MYPLRWCMALTSRPWHLSPKLASDSVPHSVFMYSHAHFWFVHFHSGDARNLKEQKKNHIEVQALFFILLQFNGTRLETWHDQLFISVHPTRHVSIRVVDGEIHKLAIFSWICITFVNLDGKQFCIRSLSVCLLLSSFYSKQLLQACLSSSILCMSIPLSKATHALVAVCWHSQQFSQMTVCLSPACGKPILIANHHYSWWLLTTQHGNLLPCLLVFIFFWHFLHPWCQLKH